MKHRITIGLGVVCLFLLSGTAFGDYANLTGGGYASFGNVYLDSRTEIGSVGSGVIDSFVRISSNQDTEQGYNTSGRPVPFDENTSPTFTHDIQIGDLIQFVNPTGLAAGTYYRFLLDINQQGSNPLLSLDQLRIYTAATGGIKSNTFAGLTQRFDLQTAGACSAFGAASCVTPPVGHGALLDYNLHSGSGNGFDMFFWVPTSVFSGLGPSTYVYLYSMFGAVGGSYVNNDGYEEWAREVPEPGFYGVLFLSLGVMILVRQQRRRRTGEV